MRDHSAPVIEKDADAVYTVSNLFESNDAKILLVDLGDEIMETNIPRLRVENVASVGGSDQSGNGSSGDGADNETRVYRSSSSGDETKIYDA